MTLGYCGLWWVVFPEQLLEVGAGGCWSEPWTGMWRWPGYERNVRRKRRAWEEALKACWTGDDTVSHRAFGVTHKGGEVKHSPLLTGCQKCISWHFQPFRVEPIQSFVFACVCFQSLWCCVMQCKQGHVKEDMKERFGEEGIWRIFGT